jgi:drug/metabolite transporter (DMT)-like permease
VPYWFFVALACALFTGCCDAVSKRIMVSNDEWATGAVLLGLSTLLLLPIVATLQFKPVSSDLVALLVVALPLEILGYYLFLSAIRTAPLSLTVPLLAFTPVMTILTSWALLGERVSWTGVIGISLVTVGAYVLNADLATRGLFSPVKALLSNAGSRRMLAVAILWSVTSSLGKKGILIYGAIPFGFVLICGDVVAFVSICLIRHRMGWMQFTIKREIRIWLLLGGLLMAGAELTHFVSLSMAPVAYMISVKRLSMVFGVMLGWKFFGEQNIRYRLLGALIMVSGVFLLY